MADLSTIDLVLRSELAQAISQSQNDTNLTNIENAVNALIADTNALRRVGDMYLAANATATGVASVDTWYTVQPAGVTGKHLNEITFDGTNKGLVAPVDGSYAITVTNLTAFGTANDILRFGIGIGDGSTQTADPDHIVDRKIGTQSDIGACSVGGIVTMTAGQVVTLEAYNTSNANDITVQSFTLRIQGVPA